MNQMRFWLRLSGALSVLVLSMSCGLSGGTSTQGPPAATPTLATIAGIDEPIVLENVRIVDSIGMTVTGDLRVLLLDAYTDESLEGGSGGAVYPDNSSDIFLTLLMDLDGRSSDNMEYCAWLLRNGRLESSGQEYQAERYGIKIDEGIVEGYILIYSIPRGSDYGSYRLELPDGQGIDLSTFFD